MERQMDSKCQKTRDLLTAPTQPFALAGPLVPGQSCPRSPRHVCPIFTLLHATPLHLPFPQDALDLHYAPICSLEPPRTWAEFPEFVAHPGDATRVCPDSGMLHAAGAL